MQWSAEEIALLATGILFGIAAAAGFHRRVELTGRSRIVFSLGAAVFVGAAITLANLKGVVYPPLTWLAPIVPLSILAVLVRDAVLFDGSPAREADTGATPIIVTRASVIPVAASQPGSPSDRMLRMRAADPTASPQELARIAYAHADMRATVAGNPATPANLLEWLASVGDPAVHSAISTRPHAVA